MSHRSHRIFFRRSQCHELEYPKSVTWVGDWEPENKYVKVGPPPCAWVD